MLRRNQTPFARNPQRPLRILHGPANVAGMASLLAKAQRGLGHHATSICLPDNGFGFRPDFILGGGSDIAPPKRVRDFWSMDFLDFDIYHFYYDTSFLGQSLFDVSILRALGKRVFLTLLGCDVRDRTQNLRKPLSVCHECSPIGCSANRLKLIEVSKQVEQSFVTTPDLLEVVPHATYLPLPVDLDATERRGYTTRSSASKSFRVLHAPTDTGKKGTRFVVDAVGRLQLGGLDIELVMPGRLAQSALHILAQTCDVAVDQLTAGVYGTFAAEMMAAGIPVIAHIDDAYLEHYPANLPIIKATPTTLFAVLRDLATNTTLLARGQIGRSWATSEHSALAVARKLNAFYDGSSASKKSSNS